MQIINLTIDLRCAKFWDLVGEDNEFDRDQLGRYMRAAYAQGYKDCHNDPEPGKWALELGFDLGTST